MGDISRNTGRAVVAGRGGKPKPRRSMSKQQQGPVERPVDFTDDAGRLPSLADREDGGITVVGQPEIPVAEVRGPSMRERVHGAIEDIHPAGRAALAAGAALAGGKISGRVTLNPVGSDERPRPPRRRR